MEPKQSFLGKKQASIVRVSCYSSLGLTDDRILAREELGTMPEVQGCTKKDAGLIIILFVLQ